MTMPVLGGQIWRGESDSPELRSFEMGQTGCASSGATVLCGRVVHQPEPGVLLAEN